MRAVSNTTPLWYLIAIELEHLLGQLFEKVLVPVAVHEKLTDSRTPETVRGRVLSMPAWFEVRTVQETETATFPVTLHRGERQAILVASTMPARRLKLPLPVELAPTYPFSSREMTSLPAISALPLPTSCPPSPTAKSNPRPPPPSPAYPKR
jgi:hypothetical protein